MLILKNLRPALRRWRAALAFTILLLLAPPGRAGSIERLIYYDATTGISIAYLTNLTGFPTT